MYIDPLFLEFIECLNNAGVKYVLVGGQAVVVHGHTRSTGDMDIYIQRTEENAEKVLKAIDDFGFGSIGFTKEDLMDEDGVVQMGRIPFRIDILCALPGLEFEEVYSSAIDYVDKGVQIKVIHINHLISNKLAVGRDRDLLDVKALKKIQSKRKQ